MNLPDFLTLPLLKRGDRGPKVRLLQEYLCLARYVVVIDGDFGPATERALVDFRADFGALGPGRSDADNLTEPLRVALSSIGSIDTIARHHLVHNPREIGGNNRGPWVRLYADGLEGQPWCGYALRFWARQARHPWAERISPDCDVIARNAKQDRRLRPDGQAPAIGDIFLRYRLRPDGTRDYVHTGVVIEVGAGFVVVISGNSNDEGSREGYEVCRAHYGLGALAFVNMSAA